MKREREMGLAHTPRFVCATIIQTSSYMYNIHASALSVECKQNCRIKNEHRDVTFSIFHIGYLMFWARERERKEIDRTNTSHVCIRGTQLMLLRNGLKIVQIIKIATEFGSDIFIDVFDILNQSERKQTFLFICLCLSLFLLCDNFSHAHATLFAKC